MTQPSRIDGLPDLPKPITNMLVGDDWQDVFDTDQMGAHYLKGYEAGSAAAAQAAKQVPTHEGTKLWLWKNGDHFLAFEHLYPCFTPDGDPMTLGEPVGFAIVKRSFDRASQSANGEKQ